MWNNRKLQIKKTKIKSKCKALQLLTADHKIMILV